MKNAAVLVDRVRRYPALMCVVIVGLLLALITPPRPSLAQVVTQITSDGTLGTVVSPPGCSVCDITGGTRPGGGMNLFHSLGLFSVGAGDTANFVNNAMAPTSNILARVTGGQVSNIFGTLQTTDFPGANLFLMNPSGVVFGPTATLNVGGSVHITTANSMLLTDGTVFDLDTLPAALTTASVESFGFLPAASATPADITVQDSTLNIPTGETFSLVGGDITIEGSPTHNIFTVSTVRAQAGRIQVTSVAGRGGVTAATGQETAGTPLGRVTLKDNAVLNTGVLPPVTASGGQIVIRGGKVIATNSTLTTRVLATPAAPAGPAGPVTLYASEEISLTSSTIRTDGIRAGGGGNVSISTSSSGKISLLDTEVFSQTLFIGGSGAVSFSTPDFEMMGGRVFTTSSGAGALNAGDILFAVNRFSLSQGSSLSAATNVAQGGSITIRGISPNTPAEKVSISGQGTSVSTNVTGTGTGGSVSVSARTFALDDASISTSTGSSEPGGTISVNAVDSASFINGASVLAEALSGGDSGSISITGGQGVDVAGGSTVTVQSSGLGDAGQINLTSTQGSISLTDSTVTAEASISDGGDIKLSAPIGITLKNSQITTSVGGGPTTVGGNIDIDPQFVILKNSRVVAQAFQGQGGNITITTNVFLADTSSVVDASSQFGVNGTVTIQSPLSNLSGTLAPMPESPLEVAQLLRAACAARMRGGEQSSFTHLSRGGKAAEPTGFLSSPYLLGLGSGQRKPGHGEHGLRTGEATISRGEGSLDIYQRSPHWCS